MDRHDTPKPETDEGETAIPVPDFGDDWVHELIAMTRPGVEIDLPARGLRERAIPFAFDDFS